MYLSLFLTAALFALHALHHIPGVQGDDLPGLVLRPGVDKTAVPDTLLGPFVQSNPLTNTSGDELQRREPTVIGGLLQIRQSCSSGFGLCANGRCCPLGGRCCTSGCCAAGSWCYSTGCCRNSEIGCAGNSCCPIGSNCCRGGGCCKSTEYCVVNSSQRGCCPLGKICTGPGGGGPPPPPPPPPPPATTHRATVTSTTSTFRPPPPTDTFSIPAITTRSSSSTVTPSRPAATSRPSTGFAEISLSYQVTDFRFTWVGSGWGSGSSSCTTSSKRTEIAGESFTLIVPGATRIYLSLDCLNTKYDVYVNGQITTFQTAVSGVIEVCNYKQVYLGARLTNVNVTVVYVGALTSITKRQTSGSQFQLNEVLAMDSITASSSASAAVTPPASGPSSGAAGLKMSWFQGFIAVLLTGLGLVL